MSSMVSLLNSPYIQGLESIWCGQAWKLLLSLTQGSPTISSKKGVGSTKAGTEVSSACAPPVIASISHCQEAARGALQSGSNLARTLDDVHPVRGYSRFSCTPLGKALSNLSRAWPISPTSSGLRAKKSKPLSELSV